MSVTVPVPQVFPTGVPARSGLAPVNAIPNILDQQAVWLNAGRKYQFYVPLGSGAGAQLTETEASAGTPAQIRVAIPAWTAYLRWAPLTERDSDDAVCYVQRIEIGGAAAVETYQHKMACPGPGGDVLMAAVLMPLSDGVPTADDEPEDIDCGTLSGARKILTINLWLDGNAEIYGMAFEPRRIRPPEITG